VGAQERTPQVHGDHPVEVFDREVNEPLLLQKPGVVHQNLRGTVSLVSRCYDLLHSLCSRDVAGRGRCLSPRLLDLGNDLVGSRTVQVVDDYSLAILRELLGDGAADPASCPRNQGNPRARRTHLQPPSPSF
jgi:hypothetical protein